MIEAVIPLVSSRIPEISSIRSIKYEGRNQMVIRKASGVGPGLVVPFTGFSVPINMRLVESFESASTSNINHLVSKRRSDRQYQKFFFCPDDSCVESFNDEDELNIHVASGAHTNKETRTSSNDTARILLYDKWVWSLSISNVA